MQRERKFGCGNFSIVGLPEGRTDRFGCKRLLCDTYRCLRCLPRKLRRMRSRIAQIATEKKLQKFVTLTLDPKKIPQGVRSDHYLRNTWRKMRVSLARRFGQSICFVGVLEFQKSGVAHLHLLVAEFIPQNWLSSAWDSVGGGKIVDIRFVDVHRIVGYLTRYLAGDKILHTVSLLPRRGRIFTCSRSIAFSGQKQAPEWWLCEQRIDTLRRHTSSVELERHELVDTFRGRGRNLLMYFEGLIPQPLTNAAASP